MYKCVNSYIKVGSSSLTLEMLGRPYSSKKKELNINRYIKKFCRGLFKYVRRSYVYSFPKKEQNVI